MPGPSLVLLPDIPSLEEQEKRAKQGLAAASLLLASRVAPQTMAPIMRHGFGVVIAEETGSVIGLTPLAPTNLLPFPFGFSDAKSFGLAPNYYLPAGNSGKSLPSFIPGVAEQRAEFAARNAPAVEVPGPRAVADANKLLSAMTVPQLEQQLRRERPFKFNLPGFSFEQTNDAVKAELARRAAAAAVTGPPPGAPVATPPNLGPNFTPPNPPLPRPSRGTLETTTPLSGPAAYYGVPEFGNLTFQQLQDQLESTTESLFLALQPGSGATQVEVERYFLNLERLKRELEGRTGTPPLGRTPGANDNHGLRLDTGNGPRVLPGAPPGLPGAPGAPALGPTGPGIPGVPSESPSGQRPIPGLPVGPLIPPVEQTPGSTPGQPRWPNRWPTPGQPFPDKFMEVAHGDP